MTSGSSLFLHHINRELLLIKGIGLDESEHIKKLKCCSLMTSGYLLAPFAQIQEIYWKSRKINLLVGELCESDKLHLCNGAPDFYSFLETRREIYSGHTKNYSMYFGKKQQHRNYYRTSPCLNTTAYIKKTFYDLVGPSQISTNFLDADDVDRLRSHANFIRNEMQDSKAAATFTVYGASTITPKPAETRFFGRISSKLFVSHYTSEHNLISPTGIFDDTDIENFDFFPLFDIQINMVLFAKLGLQNVIGDNDFHRPLLNIITHADFDYFAQARIRFLTAATIACDSKIGASNGSRYKIIKFINDLRIQFTNTTSLLSLEILLHSLNKLAEQAASSSTKFKKAFIEMVPENVTKSSLVVFTATDTEDETFRSHCAINKFNYVGIRVFDEFVAAQFTNAQGIDLWHIRTSAGSTGSHGSARISEFAVREIKPQYAFSVGIAFGLDEGKQKLDDVLVSEYIFGYEKAKIGTDKVEPRGDRIPCSALVVSFSRQYSLIDTSFKVHTGGILSGEKLVDDPVFRKSLIALDPKAIGGEMETAGLAQSCHIVGIKFVMIKGVSDFAIGKNDNHQKPAAANAFKFLFSLIGSLSNNAKISVTSE